MSVRFCVCSAQRSGSTWLVDLLGSAPGARVYGEIFLDRSSRAHSKKRSRRQGTAHLDTPFRPPMPGGSALVLAARDLGFLRRLEQTAGTGTFGFKVMYNQLAERRTLLWPLALRGYRAVHLVRRNVLAKLVSMEIARARNLYHATSDVEAATVVLDPATLLKRLRVLSVAVEHAERWLRRVPLRQVRVDYERLTADTAGTLARLESFLEIPGLAERAQSRFRPVTASSLCEKIANYDDVARVLYGSELAWCLAS